MNYEEAAATLKNHEGFWCDENGTVHVSDHVTINGSIITMLENEE